MNVAEIKKHLGSLTVLRFRLPDGSYVPAHAHVTEIGRVTKEFIDCGGVRRAEAKANVQLWTADDVDHRLAPAKFLKIFDMSADILQSTDLEIEVEYQRDTIGKYGLAFDGTDFVLTTQKTACLAQDSCGIPPKKTVTILANTSCCAGSGCC